MGYTVLGRWREADEHNWNQVNERIRAVHGGVPRGQWLLSAKFYRCISYPTRNINTMTLGDNCFVLCEDSAAPSRATYQPPPNPAAQPPPPHFRSTYVTISPPNTIDMIFHHTGGIWTTKLPGAHPGIEIMGTVYGIGDDIIIRVGRVQQKGQFRGMIIEAECLPMATFVGEPRLLNELIGAIAPVGADIKAVFFNEDQWSELLAPTEDEAVVVPPTPTAQDDSDIFTYRGDEGKPGPKDWTGLDRDKRCAFLLLRFFMNESLSNR